MCNNKFKFSLCYKEWILYHKTRHCGFQVNTLASVSLVPLYILYNRKLVCNLSVDDSTWLIVPNENYVCVFYTLVPIILLFQDYFMIFFEVRIQVLGYWQPYLKLAKNAVGVVLAKLNRPAWTDPTNLTCVGSHGPPFLKKN